MFRFFINDVLDGPIRVLEVDGRRVLSSLSLQEVQQLLGELRFKRSQLAYPIAVGEQHVALAKILGVESGDLGDLPTLLDDQWIIDGGNITGFGTSLANVMVAYVRAAGKAVTTHELERHFGRRNGHFPAELVFLDKGLLGLPEFIEDWALWEERLSIAVRHVIEERDPQRQWSTKELVPLLAQAIDLPAWLNFWALGSLLKNSSDIRHLGRNVVALSAAGDDRVRIRPFAIELLEQAGKPIPESQLLERLRKARGFSEHTRYLILNGRPFVLFGEGLVGLAPRDVPGGSAAIESATGALFATLARRQSGLLRNDVHKLLLARLPCGVVWESRLARSIVRSDGRFCTTASGGVGLREWAGSRTPVRKEVLADLLSEYDGRAPTNLVIEALSARFGEPFSRTQISMLARTMGARLGGEYVEWIPDSLEAASDAAPG